ncbi:TPA: acyltransferase, partial [Escherichia coli]|nr:acyltransferase [Escherichia coli]
MFEIIFYLYFSISMLISWKYRGLLCSSFLIATVCLINAFLGNGLTSSGYAAIPITPDSSNLMYLARVLSSPMFFEFIAGMIIYWVYDKARASHFKDLSVLLMPVSIACFALFYITGYNGGHGVFACGFYAAFLLLSLVIYEKFHKIKSMKSLDYLGNVSYSLYLVHPIVINALGYGVLVTDAYSKTKGFQNIYLIAFISILASTLLFYAIEKPFIKIARYLLTTLKPTNNALNS